MNGSCACGAVAYAIDCIDMPISHCHCITCRKTHAAAYATTAGVLKHHFTWTRGVEALKASESSPGKRRFFCGHCGSHLAAERDGAAAVIVRIATLDDAPTARPAFHVWTAHAVDWLGGDGLPEYPQWQPDR